MSTTRESAAAAAAQGDSARERGDVAAAISHYLRALQFDAGSVYAHYWLASCYEGERVLQRALDHCNAALALEPAQIAVLARKASVASGMGNALTALACYERIAALDADYPAIDALIGDELALLGMPERALARFERALRRDPGSSNLEDSLLFVGNYSESLTPEAKFERHARWGGKIERGILHMALPSEPGAPDRPLRVAYLSGDLRDHAVAIFVEPLFACHDRDRFRIECFDTFTGGEDSVTRRLRAYGDAWHRVAGMSDQGLATLIAERGIDIVVDLAGHSAMNRLPVLARKPAPVQATWLGYLNTTGLRSVDYRITDAWLDPPGLTEHLHTERLLRLRNAACFRPPSHAVLPGEPPVLRNGHVTYGSLNNWAKTNPQSLAQWRRILARNPASRLRAFVRAGDDPDVGQFVRSAIAGAEIEPHRIDVLPTLPLPSFLDALREIDIALDTFPYGGGTTTFHSLWMGIPVVTIAGANALGRNSVGPLENVGLGACIARDVDQYVEIATEMARDTATLRRIRAGTRARLAASPLLDERRFTHEFEEGLRAMWSTYCAGDLAAK